MQNGIAVSKSKEQVNSMSQYLKKKQEVVDACHTLSSMGYLAGIGGNIAARISDQLMAVTPSAADYFSMKPEDICILDLHTLEKLEGEAHPSVESGMHALIFRSRPDIHASVHTHQPVASAMAILDQSIPVLDPESRAALGDQVPVVSYGPSGTSMLVKALSKKINSKQNGYLLRNHGIVCGASDMDTAIENVHRIELAAADYLRNAIGASAREGMESLRAMALAELQHL